MARRSPVWLLACALTLATGITLLQLGTRLREAPLPSTSSGAEAVAEAAQTAQVRRFFAAANDTLRTGEPSPFDRLVAPNFQELPARSTDDAGIARLRTHLGRLRAVFPALQLTITDLVAHADEVVASVRVDGADRGSFVGIPVPSTWADWGPVDVFRFEGDRIAEHWNSGPEAPVLWPLLRGAVMLSPDAPVLSLQRLTVAPGDRVTWPAMRGPTLLLVESGAIRVAVDSAGPVQIAAGRLDAENGQPAPRMVEPATAFDLASGDFLRFTDAWFSADNTGATGATLLTVDAAPTVGAAKSLPQGASGHAVALTYPVASIARAPAISLGYADLLPGSAFPAHSPKATEMLWVESGQVRLNVVRGPARTDEGGIRAGGERILSPAETATLDAGSTVTYGDAQFDNARVFVVSLDPGDTPATTSPRAKPSPA